MGSTSCVRACVRACLCVCEWASERASLCVCVCVCGGGICLCACTLLCMVCNAWKGKDIHIHTHIIIDVHVYKSVMWFRVNVGISAGKALHFCACRWFILIIHVTYPFWKNYMIFTCCCAWWKVDHVLYPHVLWACKLKTIKRQKRLCLWLSLSLSVTLSSPTWYDLYANTQLTGSLLLSLSLCVCVSLSLCILILSEALVTLNLSICLLIVLMLLFLLPNFQREKRNKYGSMSQWLITLTSANKVGWHFVDTIYENVCDYVMKNNVCLSVCVISC